jgi:chromosomal replication initiation ATPase DnaA
LLYAMSRQLTFALPTTVDYSLTSLCPLGCQVDARTWLNNWRDWPNHGLVLMGEQASGKTHLAQVWLELAQQQPQGQLLRAADLAPERLAATLDQLAAVCPLVVVDDADQLASLSAQEGALHLYHAVQRRGGYLLLTARSAPAQVVDKGAARWGLGLADWASRVRAMAVVAVGQPSDQDLRQVLSKLFNDRQLLPDPALQDYLLARTERSFASLGQLVAALDAYSLLHQRPITLPLARQVLESALG